MNEHRDVLTANLVNQMVSLGGYKEEIVLFGTAGVQNGKSFYSVSMNRERLEEYRRQKMLRGAICFPVIRKRDYVKGITEERIQQTKEKKERLLQQLKAQFEPELMEVIQAMMENRTAKSAEAVLADYQETIDGNYEEIELQMLESLSWTAFEIGAISAEAYSSFQNYADKIRFQMRDNPVQQDLMQRTFYGFAWRTEERVFLQLDADKMVCYDRYYEAVRKGRRPGAIIHSTYYFSTMGEVTAKRALFQDFLKKYCETEYFHLSDQIWDCRDVPKTEQCMSDMNSGIGADVMAYYRGIWFKEE